MREHHPIDWAKEIIRISREQRAPDGSLNPGGDEGVQLRYAAKYLRGLDTPEGRRAGELEAACRDGIEALAMLQDHDDGGLVSPARHRLAKVLAAIDADRAKDDARPAPESAPAPAPDRPNHAETFAWLHAASRGRWDGVDAVAYVDELRRDDEAKEGGADA